MTAIPDNILIPARAEGLLAKRWAKVAEIERKSQQRGTSEKQYAAGRAISAQTRGVPKPKPQHPAVLKGLRDRANILTQMDRGLSTVPELCAVLGLSKGSVRSYLVDLASNGKIRQIGSRGTNGSGVKIWEIVK